MRPIRDPNTGRVIEQMNDDPWAELIQIALNRRLLEFTGDYDAKGRAFYRRTNLGRHGLN
jgi:hypothetical protein